MDEKSIEKRLEALEQKMNFSGASESIEDILKMNFPTYFSKGGKQ